jgi:sodium/potassium/calcium exchanger 6
VFLLTITLPVVVRPFDSLGSRHEKAPSVVHTLSTIDENDVERTLIAEEEVLAEMHELQFNKWLVAVQCAFGPLFCAAVFFSTLIVTYLTDRLLVC